jgi:two-component system chemotaxis sensor kinase CheA
VGLDVVRRNVEALHGRIDVDWTAGEGAAFTLTLPLRLTSSHGLLVRVSNQLFAIPLNVIERILYVSPQEISSLEGQDTIRYNGRPLTLVRLNDVLELPRTDVQRDSVLSPSTTLRMHLSKGEARILVVILAAAERRMAFAVDELAGEQEVVIKGLGKQLTRVGGIAGATVMGGGEVLLILNVADLIKLAMRGKRRSVLDTRPETALSGVTRAQRRILIVDDSITTRTLEKNILEAAGYTVQLAIDGHEALSAIATGGMPDLIVSDIVMPRIDGFELTRRIKDDPNTANVPVILVTSLSSPEDKARGIEAGADAYIVKSSFDQNNLLETIEQLI